MGSAWGGVAVFSGLSGVTQRADGPSKGTVFSLGLSRPGQDLGMGRMCWGPLRVREGAPRPAASPKQLLRPQPPCPGSSLDRKEQGRGIVCDTILVISF